jgi:hypothetical protein
MRKSLELIGDGDDLELIHDVEQVFGTWIQEGDWANCKTVGDIEAALLRNMQGHDLRQDRCMTALAFYDLRRNLGATIDGSISKVELSPNTPLTDLNHSPSHIAKTLKTTSSLRLRFDAGLLGSIAGASLLFSLPLFVAGGIFELPHLIIGAIGMFGGAFLLLRFDNGRFGPLQTIGDLARELARENFARFAGRGGRFTHDDVWQRLQAIAARVAEFPAEEIGRDTLLLRAEAYK